MAGIVLADGLDSGAFGLILSASYYIGFWANGGATPGKMIMHIKVVDENGQKIDGGKAFARFVGYFISGVCLFLGFMWVALDPKKQGWHDKIAKTLVVAADPPPNQKAA